MPKIPVGPWIAAQKLPNPKLGRDRDAFLERTRLRAEPKTVAGLPLVGMGGSCGKPCFALPYTIVWDEGNLDQLEGVARAFDCYLEYGLYPHLKLEADGTEVAAVQDWTTFGTVYIRPGFERGEELLSSLASALEPAVHREQ
jgi:hypothetical protein